uniref:Piwi domain-containing protein n=1 Tax=Panagrolaimus sp. JU765 TaxID=591449 RepID=A0AC34RSK7_9BILA
MGDYFFQSSRTETIDAALLQTTVEKIVRNFIANRGQPKRVVVLRDGVSEGQYTDIVDKELQAVRNGVARLCKQRVEFNLVVLTKTHVVRHFAKTPQINSLAPGTFINDGARKDLTQFYFAAHRAIQGTSQDLLATVLVNDSKASKIAVQHFLHGLCHLHGLSGTPVSLPEPVYQADILAQRGAEVFKVLNNGDIDPTNFADLTARFSYGKQQLPNQRFAA